MLSGIGQPAKRERDKVQGFKVMMSDSSLSRVTQHTFACPSGKFPSDICSVC